MSAQNLALYLVSTHFTGIIFSRSLHYSFYIWYYHTLPLLYRAAAIPDLAKPVLAIALEISWNQWQSFKPGDREDSCATFKGSLGMFVCHIVILFGLCRHMNR